MTSQNSTNKKITLLSLMRDDIRHKTWMIALSILGSFLAGPIVFLYLVTNNNRFYYNEYSSNLSLSAIMAQEKAANCLSFLQSYHMVLQLIIAFAGALIVGIFGFQYLYSKRKVDLYHSMPVSRKKLFLANWLNGFLIWLVPFLISNLFIWIGSIIYVGNAQYFGSISMYIIRNIFFLSLCYLIVYNACLVPVMVSGNVINAIVNVLIFGLFVFVSYFCIYGLMSYSLETFYVPESVMILNPIYILSPLAAPVLMAILLYDELTLQLWWWILVGSLIVMLLNFVFALALYQKRPSELAERGTEQPHFQIISRAAISVLAGLVFGLLFMSLTYRATMFWTLFGIWFGCSLSFCVLNIIYHTTFKAIFRHKLQYVIALSASAGILFCIVFDLFGYDTYLPDKNSITGLSLYSGNFTTGDYRYWSSWSSPEAFRNEPPANLKFTDKEQIWEFLSAASKGTTDVYKMPIYVKISTGLFSHYRFYYVAYEDLETAKPFLESPEYQKIFYPMLTGQLPKPTGLEVRSSDYRWITVEDPALIDQITAALCQDFSEHNSIEELCRTQETAYINVRFAGTDGYNHSLNLEIPSWYKHTMELLKEYYPRQDWDMEKKEISCITISDDLYFNHNNFAVTAATAAYEHFGFDEYGRALVPRILSQHASKSHKDGTVEIYENYSQAHVSWNFDLRDPEMVEALRPYLLLGYYNNRLRNDYVYLGEVEFADATKTSCYVAYGKLPKEILDCIMISIPLSGREDGFYAEEYHNDAVYEGPLW